MQNITALNPETTQGKSKELFESIKKKLGMVPNMMRTMGNSPAVLDGYISFSGALAKSAIGSKLGELIALAVANKNSCEYCTVAHSFISTKLIGLDQKDIELAKAGKSAYEKIQAALTFSQTLIEKRGKVSEEDINMVKFVGFNEAEITEIIAHTALNIFTNYFNNASKVVVDFPKLEVTKTAGI